MRVNTKCSIGLHCLIFMADYGETHKVTSEFLSRSTGCNAAMIRMILNALRKEGLITVSRGVGGARLNRTPEELTVWDVYRALEPDGVEHLMGIHPNPSEKCPVGRGVAAALREPYRKIGDAVKAAMESITLGQVLDYYHAGGSGAVKG